MKKIFISGSMSIKKLSPNMEKILYTLIEKKYKILVGDAYGVDELVQDYFCNKNYFYVFVYSILSNPRIYKSKKFKSIKVKMEENIKDLRERQFKKDIFMTEQADVSFVIWDGKSKGSYNNIIRSLEKNKEVQVFYNDSFIKKEDLNIEYINNIYYKNHMYSLSEYIKEEKPKIKNIKKMKEILINEGIISKDGKIVNNEYKEEIGIKSNRGKKILIYSKKILDKFFNSKDEVVKNYKKEENNNYQSENLSLF